MPAVGRRWILPFIQAPGEWKLPLAALGGRRKAYHMATVPLADGRSWTGTENGYSAS